MDMQQQHEYPRQSWFENFKNEKVYHQPKCAINWSVAKQLGPNINPIPGGGPPKVKCL